MGSLGGLPFWQVNVPEAERTQECPEYLQNLGAKDIGIIATPDEQYRQITWPEVRQIVADNRLDAFQRQPSDLRRYLAYTWKLKQVYGSVINFVLKERLGWEMPTVSRGKPFEFDEDIKILWNDWPYGLDGRIVHLVVWTKFELEDDPATDDLTDKARKEIDDYVKQKFGSQLPQDSYVWFKNWRSLKSVRAVEHFHVMMYDPDPAFIDTITSGDVPLCRKV